MEKISVVTGNIFMHVVNDQYLWYVEFINIHYPEMKQRSFISGHPEMKQRCKLINIIHYLWAKIEPKRSYIRVILLNRIKVLFSHGRTIRFYLEFQIWICLLVHRIGILIKCAILILVIRISFLKTVHRCMK